ncbi:dipeptidase [Leucobacter sp. UT-8R-CII-1-4]|uniref:dipeptidase n=1 Tax=Leucobacter sp. UT-8R-CII-1-4 TaxID=3040075 RepID=UPI0024A8E7F0|nr:dipeptidase [Leucobacter sp. UT-8R-CII-1-4]MDI6023001.1 dipeptidase [Leucobacter sp. UT-8R-CII-1-4]
MMNELHSRAIVADTHNDLLMGVAARHPRDWAKFFRARWLPQLQAGGVKLQVLPVFIDEVYRFEGALRQTMRMVEAAHVLAEGNADTVSLCTNGAEIDAALAADKIALVLALESAPGVGEDIHLLDTLSRLGVRVASLAHFGRTPLADGSAEDAAGSALTGLGVEAVAEMNRLGMIFDVSHLGKRGVDHVLELSKRPIMATHSSARALYDHHRNLSDVHLRAIADGNGIVCVNFFAPYLHATDRTVDPIIDHIEHIVGVAGIERVGLGPDFVKEVIEETTPPCCEPDSPSADSFVPGLEGPSGLPMVTARMQERGWQEADIRAVLGENVHRFFQRELGVTSANYRSSGATLS